LLLIGLLLATLDAENAIRPSTNVCSWRKSGRRYQSARLPLMTQMQHFPLDRYKPSYRSVITLDARRLPKFN